MLSAGFVQFNDEVESILKKQHGITSTKSENLFSKETITIIRKKDQNKLKKICELLSNGWKLFIIETTPTEYHKDKQTYAFDYETPEGNILKSEDLCKLNDQTPIISRKLASKLSKSLHRYGYKVIPVSKEQ